MRPAALLAASKSGTCITPNSRSHLPDETSCFDMETTSCLLCGTEDGLPILRRKAPVHCICRRCGFVYQSPRLDIEEMRLHYANEYWESRVNDVKESKSPRAAAIVEWVSDQVGTRDIIAEVGCGNGSILASVHDALGCRAVGIEPSQQEAQAARERYGLEMYCSTLEQLQPGDLPPLNLLILSHVAEHFHHPTKALRACRETLVDGGLIWLEVPKILNPSAQKRLSTWLAFEHISYFSVGTLSWFLATAGFKVLRSEGHEHHVRILAAKSEQVPVPTLPNEYSAVRRALRAHEIRYWPWYVWKRLRG